jgi:hypothetical protein
MTKSDIFLAAFTAHDRVHGRVRQDDQPGCDIDIAQEIMLERDVPRYVGHCFWARIRLGPALVSVRSPRPRRERTDPRAKVR